MTSRGSGAVGLDRELTERTGARTRVGTEDGEGLCVIREDERLKPGLSATVELLVSEHPGALWVPLAAVFVDDLDRTIVYRRSGRGAEAQVVELGGSTDRVAIVRSGLEEGDEILLAPPEPS